MAEHKRKGIKGLLNLVLKQNNVFKHQVGDGMRELGACSMTSRYICCFISLWI